jgi:hypothetical protein
VQKGLIIVACADFWWDAEGICILGRVLGNQLSLLFLASFGVWKFMVCRGSDSLRFPSFGVQKLDRLQRERILKVPSSHHNEYCLPHLHSHSQGKRLACLVPNVVTCVGRNFMTLELGPLSRCNILIGVRWLPLSWPAVRNCIACRE